MDMRIAIGHKVDVRQPTRQAVKRDPSFQPRQVKTQARVLTGGERDVRQVLAEDVGSSPDLQPSDGRPALAYDPTVVLTVNDMSQQQAPTACCRADAESHSQGSRSAILRLLAQQSPHGWWGRSGTIRPLASLSSVPSASVMVAPTKTFLRSIWVMRPRAVKGSSIGVIFR
jgi:hypothetical protein